MIENFPFCCAHGCYDDVQRYLSEGIVPDINYDNGIAGICASRAGDVLMLKLLIDKGYHIFKYKKELFNASISSGKIDCINFLLNQMDFPDEIIPRDHEIKWLFYNKRTNEFVIKKIEEHFIILKDRLRNFFQKNMINYNIELNFADQMNSIIQQLELINIKIENPKTIQEKSLKIQVKQQIIDIEKYLSFQLNHHNLFEKQ